MPHFVEPTVGRIHRMNCWSDSSSEAQQEHNEEPSPLYAATQEVLRQYRDDLRAYDRLQAIALYDTGDGSATLAVTLRTHAFPAIQNRFARAIADLSPHRPS